MEAGAIEARSVEAGGGGTKGSVDVPGALDGEVEVEGPMDRVWRPEQQRDSGTKSVDQSNVEAAADG
eukprot:CAMPEP_0183736530 /NCGR_PEP_ID=MMETSP0737-20130205/49525_1 /TAXON_ID=385413 /ORGANISM="Thalassiosira miniscula, Strain CCMP1093" /LENGTH=66 /DNA_ID=CAMNT_0025970551 /DNA_START=58 /DNA_END=259 /DNA_ORIENTATION=+